MRHSLCKPPVLAVRMLHPDPDITSPGTICFAVLREDGIFNICVFTDGESPQFDILCTMNKTVPPGALELLARQSSLTFNL